ncbi:MAG: cytochrome c oxidase assembly protein [Betaproteobacteria bacterium RIFCSPLOWO2_12_FULL_64_23]|nr:MAG: cytochrome c oxidase assembly protein [Betaproteobacteria bacterium RIFCSPLOWO2_12_FULL_64_23]
MSAPAAASASNRRMLKKLLVVALGMFGFGFALVPFYEKVCEIAGLRNVWQPGQAEAGAANTQVDLTRTVTVEFDSNIRMLPWTFKPMASSVEIHPGELIQMVYEVRNTLAEPVTGQAVPSYGPRLAAQYFRKLECFCFTQQTLAAGEVRQMPVVFVIDPSLPKDVNTITLSYTFFRVDGANVKAGKG